MTPPSISLLLTINAGSSSLKFALFRRDETPARLFSGAFDRIGLPQARLRLVEAKGGAAEQRAVEVPRHADCVPLLLDLLEARGVGGRVRAVAHRVVHGGTYTQPALEVTPAVLATLRRFRAFDPDHLPAELALIQACAAHFPGTPQLACLDTAFHRELPRVAQLLPIPRRYFEAGVRRYGFHGLSYGYLLEELARLAGPEAARGRLLLAHLGNGASMAAVRGGTCLDTSMAFTPAAGLVMSSRSGDLDPGLIAYLAREEGMTVHQFNTMVNTASGLLGVSETSPDVRDLLEREAADPRAAEALQLFCYQARKWIGALAAVLGGLDTLVFAGGIGENSTVMRERICAGLTFLGVTLDPERNAASAPVISREGAAAVVRIIRTDEELAMARLLARWLAEGAPA